jgi:nucleotide-binding universal stress UspA family protein
MKKIKKILACIDFSDYSLRTLEYAVGLAKNENRKIIIYNVINMRNLGGLETMGSYFSNSIVLEDYVNDLKKERLTMINNIIKEHFFNEKQIISIKIDTGIPFECILKAAETEKADLIVMGNKGRGNIAKVLFGSAAEKVFRHSPIPVVSVRDKMNFKRR